VDVLCGLLPRASGWRNLTGHQLRLVIHLKHAFSSDFGIKYRSKKNLIVMDIRKDSHNADCVLHKVKSVTTKLIPLIVLTAFSDFYALHRCLDLTQITPPKDILFAMPNEILRMATLKIFTILTVLLVTYWVWLAIYRLCLSPLAVFPGPKLAAMTTWHAFYYEVIKDGQFTFHIKDLHRKYGMKLFSLLLQRLTKA
jgi:hypothetical protein